MTKKVNNSPNPILKTSEDSTSKYFHFLLGIMVFLFFLPTLKNDFILSDDPSYITDNPYIRSFNLFTLKWMFTNIFTGNWIPMTWLSLSLDYSMAGLDPRIYHFTNLLLHIFNTITVYFLTLKLLKIVQKTRKNGVDLFPTNVFIPSAFLTSLFFGLHPIHVESVAWAAERRDVLCSFFYLGCLYYYLDYITANLKKTRYYLYCLVLFILALASKPMAVTLPFVLLLLDFWPLERIRSNIFKIFLEKLPFLIGSGFVSVTTYLLQSGAGAFYPTVGVSLSFHIMNAFHSLAFYLGKMIFPTGLSPLYPIVNPQINTYSIENLFTAFLVVVITIGCFYFKKRKPYLLLVWFYYIITLVPVLGIPQVGFQAAADRFTYLPSLGLFLLFSTWLMSFRPLENSGRIIVTGAFALFLGLGTVNQLGVWRNSVIQWEYIAKKYPNDSQIVLSNLAEAYLQVGRFDEALKEYDKAIAIPTPNAFLQNGKGVIFLQEGRFEEAIQQFNASVAINPEANNSLVHKNLWNAYEKIGKHQEAYEELLKAIKDDPKNPENYLTLGISYWNQNKMQLVEEAFRTAHNLDAYNPVYLANLASVFQREGKLDDAISLYQSGLSLNPKEPLYYLGLGSTFLLKGKLSEAFEILQAGQKLQPNNPEFYKKLGLSYEQAGQKEIATQYYEKAKALSN